MNKTLKTLLAGLLMVPVLAFGMNLTTQLTQPAYAQGSTIKEGIDATRGDEQPTLLFGDGGVFSTLVNLALFLIGALSVLMLIYGGIRYTLSGGDSKAVEAAKNTILYAIIGVIIAVLAYAIVNFVLTSFTAVA